MGRPRIKRNGPEKRINVPFTAEEAKRLFGVKPGAVRAATAWVRQLTMERVEQLEQAAKAKGIGR